MVRFSDSRSVERVGKGELQLRSRSWGPVPAGNDAGLPTGGTATGTASEQSINVDASWPTIASLAIA